MVSLLFHILSSSVVPALLSALVSHDPAVHSLLEQYGARSSVWHVQVLNEYLAARNGSERTFGRFFVQGGDLLLYTPDGTLQRSWQLGGLAASLAALPGLQGGCAAVALQGGLLLRVDVDNDSLQPLLKHHCTITCVLLSRASLTCNVTCHLSPTRCSVPS